VTDPKSYADLLLFVTYVAPGLVILWARARFLSGRMLAGKDGVLGYITLSVVFLLLVQLGILLATGRVTPPHELTPWWPAISLVGAAAFGAALGLDGANGWTRRGLARLGLGVVAAHGTAWDAKFSRLTPCLMVVTLKDGSGIAGWCGEESFIGSDPAGRDLYLEQVYADDGQGNWVIQSEGAAVYIVGSEIRAVELSVPPA